MYTQFQMETLTLTTDFGMNDGYSAAMKGVILKINPKQKIIDITHSILPQNVRQGAFILYSIAPYFQNAIHVCVIDPGVGSSRAGLIIQCQSCVLVGPDNGVLAPSAERLGIEKVIKITNSEFCLPEISSTFHGRDIFAPVAAHISKGIKLEEFGEVVSQFEKLNLFDISEEGDEVLGQVLNIDNFGNIITNFSQDLVEKYFKFGDTLSVTTCTLGSWRTWKIPYNNTYNSVPEKELLATISSTGFLELAGNRCNANEKLNLKISDNISFQK